MSISTPLSPKQKLLKATAKNNIIKVKRLLDEGIPIDCHDETFFYYNTPLAIAAEKGYTELVRLLLEHGALVNITNTRKNTPLHRAAFRGHAEVVKLLLKYGAESNAKGSDGHTPLYMATDNNHIETMHVLLQHGADPNIPTTDSYQVPLHIAAYKNYETAAQLLLAAGTVLDHQNGAQITPLDLARLKNNTKIVTLFDEYKTISKRQFFEHALSQGYYRFAQQLIKDGVSVTTHDLFLVYKHYLQADESTKNIYRALAQLLIAYLRLTSTLQELSKLYASEKISLISTLNDTQKTDANLSYPIAKQGLVGFRGLTKDLAEHIARYAIE